ncbi:uncharacterized protein CTHT_0057160 [Thermochaetoides thermophila DSM 1495]|uniref:Uncharacterized protein n=1 Tax=Chaetomium thermophilum (strain DSM 1495 / CBS 144.50 / IMI 039719) TaxID=759272 RepID=G0SCG7_CHATD|nr:hypothetical protein CTHT_0057160 [Thermochaetoides thermophila DSM 1495]EGS19093.1 hypothetical protein CTHT_0057160 [Thermochaetoides thermophila DSM 1495]
MSRNSSEDSRFSFSQWCPPPTSLLMSKLPLTATSQEPRPFNPPLATQQHGNHKHLCHISNILLLFPVLKHTPLQLLPLFPAHPLPQYSPRRTSSLPASPSPHQILTFRDDAVTDLADKLSVLLGEIGRQEAQFACRWEEVRGMLKVVRGTERGVARVRMLGERCRVEVGRLRERVQRDGDANGGGDKGRRLVEAEMELVRLEAEELVAEAQLGGVAILARHGLRLLSLLDSTPLVPGEVRPAFPATAMAQARQILNDAEDDLRTWELSGMDRMLYELSLRPDDVAHGQAVGQHGMAWAQHGRMDMLGDEDGNGGGDGDGDGDGDGGIPEEEGDGDRDEGGAEEDEREEEQTAPPVPPRPRKKGKSKQESLGSESGSEGGVEG